MLRSFKAPVYDLTSIADFIYSTGGKIASLMKLCIKLTTFSDLPTWSVRTSRKG